MKSIKVISDAFTNTSRFLKLRNAVFLENGFRRSWDYVESKDSVTALIFDKANKDFLLVSQFRPALYFGASPLSKSTIDPSTLGNCYELCAGLLDDPKRSREQVMADEIREELGYDVKKSDLQFIGRSPGSVGMSGARMYMFYTEVVPEMKKYSGGGLKEEGEQINEKRVPLEEIDAFIADYNQEKSAAIIMGVYWWKQHMASKYMK